MSNNTCVKSKIYIYERGSSFQINDLFFETTSSVTYSMYFFFSCIKFVITDIYTVIFDVVMCVL